MTEFSWERYINTLSSVDTLPAPPAPSSAIQTEAVPDPERLTSGWLDPDQVTNSRYIKKQCETKNIRGVLCDVYYAFGSREELDILDMAFELAWFRMNDSHAYPPLRVPKPITFERNLFEQCQAFAIIKSPGIVDGEQYFDARDELLGDVNDILDKLKFRPIPPAPD